jgi:acyl carrier protein
MRPDIEITTLADLADLNSKIYESGSANADANASEILPAQEQEVFKIWVQVLGFDSFSMDEDLFQIGGDSIAAVQIFSAVNEKFGVNLSMQELFSTSHFSIKWLSELISKYQVDVIGEEEYSRLLKHIDGLSVEEAEQLLALELSKTPR